MSGDNTDGSQQEFELPIYKARDCDSKEQAPAEPQVTWICSTNCSWKFCSCEQSLQSYVGSWTNCKQTQTKDYAAGRSQWPLVWALLSEQCRLLLPRSFLIKRPVWRRW